MANWKNNIKVQVSLPYYTQNTMELHYNNVKVDITASDIWFSGHDRASLVWKAYVACGCTSVLIVGKATYSAKRRDYATTTHQVEAGTTYDGMTGFGERYKTKVLSYN